MLKLRNSILFIGMLTMISAVYANNISLTDVGLVGRDVSAGNNNPANFVYVKFDISWENSWRTSSALSNWDAAWVFVKYRVGSGEWKHASLHTSLHLAPTGSTITTSSDGKGVFIYRDSDGSGTVSYTNVKLRWDYGVDGVLDSDQVSMEVMTIEMVYVPQGTFHVGTKGTEIGSFTDGSWRSGGTIKFQIASEAALSIDSSAGCLWGTSTSGVSTIGDVGTLAANFPKGYHAFYCMKYSISQRQYVDFLNLLTYSQQASRTAVAPSSLEGTKAMYTTGQLKHRSGIEIQTSGIESSTPAIYASDLNDDGNYNQNDDGQHVACNYLSWADGIAYTDWAALRPMSELEFEKSCRGTVDTSTGEMNDFIWGGAFVGRDTSIISDGTSSETALPSIANAHFSSVSGNVQGPLRVGIFARSTTTRSQAGATYYGIMDMGGDVWERPVTVGNNTGRLFEGTHGDGNLNANGDASGNSDWPGTDAAGAGFRGGVWDASDSYMRISDRAIAVLTSSTRGGNDNTSGTRGCRSVRTAQ